MSEILTDTEKRKSNASIAAENLKKLETWLSTATAIPAHNGKANLSAICLAAEVDRQVIYSNPKAKALIEEAVSRVGLAMPEQARGAATDAVPTWARQRIKELEEALAVSKAEARDLRARVRRLEILDRHVADTGMYPR